MWTWLSTWVAPASSWVTCSIAALSSSAAAVVVLTFCCTACADVIILVACAMTSPIPVLASPISVSEVFSWRRMLARSVVSCFCVASADSASCNKPRLRHCCHGNQSLLFEHKIGYNSTCIGDTSLIFALNRDLSGRWIELYKRNLSQTKPCYLGNKNLECLQINCYNGACGRDICPRFLHKTGSFRGERIYLCCLSKICLKPTPVTMHTNKNLEILTQN